MRRCLILLLAWGCSASDDDGSPEPAEPPPSGDGEGEGEAAAAGGLPGPAADYEPVAPAPPIAPHPPLAACPEGWIDEGEICQPPPARSCSESSFQTVGSERCEVVGTDCPVGAAQFLPESELRALAPGFDGPIIHADPGAGRDGDGSVAAPRNVIPDAPVGAIVTLPRGEWSARQTVSGYALVGACPRQTVLRIDGRRLLQLDGVPAGPTLVANLTVVGGSPGISGDLSDGDGEVAAKGVVVSDSVGSGIIIVGSGAARLEDIVVRGVSELRDDAVGVGAGGGAEIAVVRGVIEDVQGGAALSALGGGRLSLTDVAVRRVSGAGASGGFGIKIGLGGAVRGDRVIIEDAARLAVRVRGPDRSVLTDLVVRGATDREVTVAGGTLSLRRARVLGPSELGIMALALDETTGVVEFEDLRVHGVSGLVGGGLTGGLVVHGEGAVIRGERLVVSDVVGDGISAGLGGRLDVTDLRVFDVRHKPDPEPGNVTGVGIQVIPGGSAVLRRAEIVGASSFGLLVVGQPGIEADLDGEDVMVGPMTNPDPTTHGTGIVVIGSGTTSLRRSAIRAGPAGGLAVGRWGDGRPVVELEDLTVADLTAVAQSNAGYGVLIRDDADVTLRRVLISDVEYAGLFIGRTGLAGSEGGEITVTASELAIRRVRSSGRTLRRGMGLVVAEGARVALQSVLIEDVRQFGVAAFGWGLSPETRLSMDSLVLRNVLAAECAERAEGTAGSCVAGNVAGGGGSGLAPFDGARVALTDFRITGCAVAAVMLPPDSLLTAARGVVTGNNIGLALASDPADPNAAADPELLQRLSDGVFTFDNALDVSRDIPLAPPDVGTLSDLAGLTP